MNKSLFLQAVSKFGSGLLIVGLMIFGAAGTVNFLNGWLFIGVLFVPMFVAGIIMMFWAPELLKKRLNMKEKQKEQKMVIVLSGVMFSTGFVVAGLTHRYNWYMLPQKISVGASIVFLLGYLFYAMILKSNEYLSRTVEVQVDQKVVDSGFYSVVRHPMYGITILLFLTMPLILGSIFSFFVFLIYPFIVVKRIKNEEMVLEKELKGYKEYQKKVKYRLIPFVW